MGGKPSKGTSKDMSLSRNKPTASPPQKPTTAQKQTKQQVNKGKGGY